MLDLGGAVMGFAPWGEQRDDALRGQGLGGEISAIYLRRAAQRQGHGRALMAHAARRLLARGHRGASLWVVRDNPLARAFYEALGGTPYGEAEDSLADTPVAVVGYAWTSLPALATMRDEA